MLSLISVIHFLTLACFLGPAVPKHMPPCCVVVKERNIFHGPVSVLRTHVATQQYSQ